MKRTTISSRELNPAISLNLLVVAGLAISAGKIEFTELDDTQQATLANKALTIASPLVSEATCVKEIHISADTTIVKVEGRFNSEVAKTVQWITQMMKAQSLSSVFFPALSTENETTIFVGQKSKGTFSALAKNVIDAKILGQEMFYYTDQKKKELRKVDISTVITDTSWQSKSQILKSFSSDIQGLGRFSVKSSILPVTLSGGIFQKLNVETGTFQVLTAPVEIDRTYLGQFRLSDKIDYAYELFLGANKLIFGKMATAAANI